MPLVISKRWALAATPIAWMQMSGMSKRPITATNEQSSDLRLFARRHLARRWSRLSLIRASSRRGQTTKSAWLCRWVKSCFAFSLLGQMGYMMEALHHFLGSSPLPTVFFVYVAAVVLWLLSVSGQPRASSLKGICSGISGVLCCLPCIFSE